MIPFVILFSEFSFLDNGYLQRTVYTKSFGLILYLLRIYINIWQSFSALDVLPNLTVGASDTH